MIRGIIYELNLGVTFCNFRKGVLIFKEALAGTVYYTVSRPKLS
jgi:hypothetical protein